MIRAAILFIVISLSLSHHALAQSQGPNNAGTGINYESGYTNWSNPGNITSPPGTPCATITLASGDTGDGLLGTNYGFSIPANATINGIVVTINREGQMGLLYGIQDNYLALYYSGSPVTDNTSRPTRWPTSFETTTYGAADSTWGHSWTPVEINDPSFGVLLRPINKRSAESIATVDYMQITVHYTLHSITGFSPNSACSGSGAPVVITGTNLTGATAVTFYNAQAAASYTVNSATQITAFLPAGATTGPISVTIPPNCTITSLTDFTVNALPVPVASSNSPVCVVGNLGLTGAPDGMTSYAWTGPNGFTSSLQSPSIIGVAAAAAGTYTLTVTNGNGCSASAATNVVINALPAPVASSNSPVCVGRTLALTCKLGGMTSYAWTGPNGFTSSLQNPSIFYVTATAAGTYTLNVTNGGGCSASSTTDVAINALPVPVASSNSPVCVGSTLALTGTPNGMTDYAWAGPNGFTSTSQSPSIASVSAAAAGTYTLTVTNGSGCSASATTSLTVRALPATPTITPSGPITFCDGDSVTLTSSNGSGWSWSTSPVVNTKTIKVKKSGSYTVQVKNNYGCWSAPSAPVVVTVNPSPPAPTGIAASPATICNGTSSVISVNDPGAGYTTDWYTVSCGGTAVPGGTGVNSLSVNPTITTIYFARTRDTSTGCLSACVTVTVTVIQPPVAPTVAAASRNNFCSDDAGNITLSYTGGSGTTLKWYAGGCGSGSSIGSGQNLSIASPTTTTTYYARWESDPCTASACASITVTVNQVPVAPTGAATDRNNFCANDDGNITLSYTGGSGTILKWYAGGCGSGSSIGTGQNLTIASPTTTTTYYARWESDPCGQSSCASVTITVNPLPSTSAIYHH